MTVNNRMNETLSALMDGEASELELHRTLKEVSEHSELRDSWRRYQLVSAAMKRDLPPRIKDMSLNISAALDDEPAHKSSVIQTFLQPLGKVAVAASVALLAVFSVQQMQWLTPADSHDAGSSIAFGSSVNAPVVAGSSYDNQEPASGDSLFQLPAGYDLPPVSARTVSTAKSMHSASRPTVLVTPRPIADIADEKALRDFFNAMMARHTEVTSQATSNQGVLSLARLPQTENQH